MEILSYKENLHSFTFKITGGQDSWNVEGLIRFYDGGQKLDIDKRALYHEDVKNELITKIGSESVEEIEDALSEGRLKF